MTIAVIEIINQNALYKGYVSLCSHWVYSITTRIKTTQQWLCLKKPAHWVYSITTRIKTSCLWYSWTPWLIEYIPLQQGLRLHTCCHFRLWKLIEYIPLQQGLRLEKTMPPSYFLTHWVYSITTRIKTDYNSFIHYV